MKISFDTDGELAEFVLEHLEMPQTDAINQWLDKSIQTATDSPTMRAALWAFAEQFSDEELLSGVTIGAEK